MFGSVWGVLYEICEAEPAPIGDNFRVFLFEIKAPITYNCDLLLPQFLSYTCQIVNRCRWEWREDFKIYYGKIAKLQSYMSLYSFFQLWFFCSRYWCNMCNKKRVYEAVKRNEMVKRRERSYWKTIGKILLYEITARKTWLWNGKAKRTCSPTTALEAD